MIAIDSGKFEESARLKANALVADRVAVVLLLDRGSHFGLGLIAGDGRCRSDLIVERLYLGVRSDLGLVVAVDCRLQAGNFRPQLGDFLPKFGILFILVHCLRTRARVGRRPMMACVICGLRSGGKQAACSDCRKQGNGRSHA